MCGQNVDFLNIKADGAYNYHYAMKDYWIVFWCAPDVPTHVGAARSLSKLFCCL